MAQTKPETIKKLRGQLLATIKMLHERGVSREAIEAEVEKAGRVRYGDEWDAMVQRIFEPEAAETRKSTALDMEPILFRDGVRGENILGAGHLTRGAGTWAPQAQQEKPVSKARDRKQSAEDARDAEVIENMKKVHADIFHGGQS